MLRQATNRILLRSAATSRVFSTEATTIPESDTTFVEKWKKMIPNLDPPKTPSAYMKARPPTPSTIPSKLTVNLALPYSSLLSSKEGMSTHRSLQVLKMGTVNYLNTLKLQEELVCDRKTQKITNTLLSLQHPPTYTLGKRKTEHNLLVSENELRNMGAELHYTQRGGDITYHGPNQAILYPIISLREIGIGARSYVEKLEETMIELASIYGVTASRGRKCETGVWVGDRKIGAIGVRIQNGVTSHGLAFNIDPDLNYFKHIVPCGISDKEVTSLKRETSVDLPSEEVIQDQLISCFAKQFGFSVVVLDKSDIQ